MSGDTLFDVLRGKIARSGDDLYLVGGNIGNGSNRNVEYGINAESGNGKGEKDDYQLEFQTSRSRL